VQIIFPTGVINIYLFSPQFRNSVGPHLVTKITSPTINVAVIAASPSITSF